MAVLPGGCDLWGCASEAQELTGCETSGYLVAAASEEKNNIEVPQQSVVWIGVFFNTPERGRLWPPYVEPQASQHMGLHHFSDVYSLVQAVGFIEVYFNVCGEGKSSFPLRGPSLQGHETYRKQKGTIGNNVFTFLTSTTT